jgi:4-nitrophenyl phosphatase
MTWVLDCDGVIWLTDDPIPGAAGAVAELRERGERVVFVTNNSYPVRAVHLAKLEKMGMASSGDDLITSASAAASLVEEGERALVVGGPGILEALSERGVEAVEAGTRTDDGGFDVVIVGFDPKFDFARLSAATVALRAGARLVATNDDPTFPTSSGLMPGGGSFTAAVACAGGVEPTVAGKPFPALVELLRSRVGDIDIVVGDRPSTDGGLAVRLGAGFGLVLTGVTPADHGPLEPTPAFEAPDLATLVPQVLRGA